MINRNIAIWQSLNKIWDKSEALYLPELQSMVFHPTAAQLLYITPGWKRDIQTTITFLTTILKKLDKDDCMKLRRFLDHLKGKKK